MFKRETIAMFCLFVGQLLGWSTKLHVITGIFFLAALALSIITLVEEYKNYKGKKEQ